MDLDERSLVGCSAGMAADRAEPSQEERTAATRKLFRGPRRIQPAPLVYSAEDALPNAMCKNCGMKAARQHATAAECISALRDVLSRFL